MLNKINKASCEIDSLIRLDKRVSLNWSEKDGDAIFLKEEILKLVEQRNQEIILLTEKLLS